MTHRSDWVCACISYNRVKEVNALFNTLGETQPKGSSGGSGVSREDVVYEKCSELLERLPEDYKEDDYKAKLNKLGGLAIPLNIFLFQEVGIKTSCICYTKSSLEADDDD